MIVHHCWEWAWFSWHRKLPAIPHPGASLGDLRPAAWTGVCGGEGSLAHRAPKGKQAVPVRERGLSPHRNFIQPPKTVTFGHRPQHGEPRRQQAKWSEGSNAGAGHQRPAAPGAAGGGGGLCEKGGGSEGGPLLGWAQSLSWALTISGIVLPMHLRGSLMPLHDTPVTDKTVHFMLFTFRRQ